MSAGRFTGSHTVKLVDDNVNDVGTPSNPLSVSVSGAGSGGTSTVDKAAFTAGSSAGTALMGVVTPTDVGLAADKVALAALDANRNLKVNLAAGSISGNSAASATGSAVPASADYQGINVGGNLRGNTGYDVDTGAGTEYVAGAILRKSASGGSVELGTATDPIRTDPTGSTTQPVSGTVTVQQSTASNLKVDLSGTAANATAIKVDGSAVTQPISASSLPLPTGAATAAKQPALGTAGTASADVITIQGIASMTPVKVDLSSTGANATAVKVDGSAVTQPVSIAGTVAVTESGTWTVQPGNTANTTPWLVTDTPATSGGLSKSHLVSAATTNATNVKASAGQVYCITAFNLNASPRYLKFHNTAGTPTAGSGVTDTFLIPGNASGAGLVLNIDKGIAFSTGIAFTLVTGIADADATAVGASEVVVNIYYK